MSGESLESLLEDPTIREAVSVVLHRSKGDTEELEWADVADVLSSSQWGQLIQEDVLIEGASGFMLADPDRVREVLKSAERDEASGVDVMAIESEPWTRYDKIAGLVALVFFAGYWNTHIRDVIASFDDIVLGPIVHVLPFFAVILLLAVVTGLYSTVLQARLKNSEVIEAYQKRMSELRERKEAAKERGDEAALEAIQEEQLDAAGDQFELLKVQFRPMVWIMLLTIPVFLWLRWKVRGGHLGASHPGIVVPLFGAVSWQQSLVGPMPTWILWYLLCSFASRQIIQKPLDVRPSRTTSRQ